MTRIGAHLSGLEMRLLQELEQANAAAAVNSLRLATGEKINSPSDDPAAFFELSSLQNRLSVVNDTISQVDAAAGTAAQMQLALDQIRTQLGVVRTALAADEDGGLTGEQRIEYQADIDAALAQIDTLAGTEVNGRRVLDGSTNYRFTGRNGTQIRDLQVYALSGSTAEISGTVTQLAQQATLLYTGPGGKTTDAATISLTGRLGTTSISVVKNESLSDVADKINADSHATGITAEADGNELTFTTVDYGTNAIIEIDVESGIFAVTGGNGDGTAQGVNAEATINGHAIDEDTADGNKMAFSENGVHFTIEFAAGFSGAFDTVTVSDEGVMQFALSTRLNDISSLAVPGVQTARLGGLSGTLNQLVDGGALGNLGDNASQAIRVVDEALGQLTLIESRVDRFADVTVASSAAVLEGFQETLEDRVDDLNEVDDDAETLLLAKNQALAANALSALSILRQQQSVVVNVIEHLAGLD